MDRNLLTTLHHIDVVPRFKVARNFCVRSFISGAQIRECLSGKHDAPAERVIGSVALIDGDVMRGVGLFHEDGEIHAGRTTAADVDFHAESSSSALPSRSIPALNSSGGQHIPRRRWCGDSKKRPGTNDVSYFS